MNFPGIKSAAEQVAESLTEAIRSGRYPGRLPGYRRLMRDFSLSRGVAESALALLAERGVVRAAGERRRHEAIRSARGGASAKAVHRRRVLLLSMDAESDPHALLSRNVARWSEAITAAKLDLRVEFLDAVQARRPHRRWDELLNEATPDRLLLIAPSEPVSRWAVTTGVRTLCLGGVYPKGEVDGLGVSAQTMMVHAIDRLASLGHRDFCLPLAGRIPVFADAAREVVRTRLEAHGVRYIPRLHTPSREECDAELYRELLESRLRERIPSAMLVFDANELAAAQWVLQLRGLRVPEQVSLVVLGELPYETWWSAAGGPARFHFDEERLTRALVKRLSVPDGTPFLQQLIALGFVPGGTMGPPP